MFLEQPLLSIKFSLPIQGVGYVDPCSQREHLQTFRDDGEVRLVMVANRRRELERPRKVGREES